MRPDLGSPQSVPADLPAVPSSPAASRPGRLVRHLFRPFAEVREEEVPAMVALSTNAFLMMTAYYILKTVREPLILQGGTGGLSGVELKTYATAAQAVLLLALVPLYSHVAGRVTRLRLVRVTVALAVASLLLFAGLGALEIPIGIPYYLWLGMGGLIGIAQFWSFANDYYTRLRGERLFPLIAAGGTLGAILGSGVARWLLSRTGLTSLMLISAALLVAYAAVFGLIERLEHPAPDAAETARSPVDGRTAFQLVAHSRYLQLIAVMVMVANLVNTQGEYVLAHAVNSQAEQLVPAPAPASELSGEARRALRDARRVVVGQLYGEFYGGVNLFGFLIQIVFVSRLFKYLGVHGALYVFPLVALGAYGSMAAAPAFALIAAAKTIENSADYSLHNTIRHALFLPTGRDAKYKAKAAIDSLCLRSGDLIAGATVFAGIHLFHLSARAFALGNMLLIVAWLAITVPLSRHYRRLAAAQGAGAP
jgi:ATP:ADP antiporter, AAA family